MNMVVKRFKFDAAHWLPGYNGKCANLHGHQWVLEVGVTGITDPNTGMIMDFTDLKKIVNKKVIDRLDHQCLNNIVNDGFPYDCPTSEMVADWIMKVLYNALKETKVQLAMVRLWESEDSYFEWRKQ